ncbi:MAG: SUMF1/EgtB/PvdO family nonheme iron enzyme [Planctomycetota bacterium]
MTLNRGSFWIGCLAIALSMAAGPYASAVQQSEIELELTDVGRSLEVRYANRASRLRNELAVLLPSRDSSPEVLSEFLSDDQLDTRLAEFVVIDQATPRALAEFGQQSDMHAELIERLLADHQLMIQMLVADGAKSSRAGRSQEPPEFGRAMQIYNDIQNASELADSDVFQRLALAISLEHAVPVQQVNPTELSDAPEFVDPVNRYLHYEQAFRERELDPEFERLSTWELRFVVNGDEPDETLAWGREMLRNYRPDHIRTSDFGWRYVNIVGTDVKYGSENVKYDRPELQKYQNILMNGGVCGRRAFFGRFILRAFGVPTIARPSRGHGALAHWTPDGWVVNLGGGWGAGWTKTRYHSDLDFLATTQARRNPDAFMKVKRARWIGDVLNETRSYAESEENAGVWNAMALVTRRSIIEQGDAITLEPLGEDIGEANESIVPAEIVDSPVTDEDRAITRAANGVITIPAAAFSEPSGNTREVLAMESFGGGMQIHLPRFFPQGKTILRGGTWKGTPDACASGSRMLSGGYGRYENWGLRAAVSNTDDNPEPELTIDIGNGILMKLVYISPGSFVMGGESEEDGRFECVEVPMHEVQLTRGFYLGIYEVTQAQFEAVMGANPSRSTIDADCPVDNVSEADALSFCGKLAEQTGLDVRLPTEAEWEYASRAGSDAKWFFGDDPSEIGEYAWYRDNSDARSHPVGQKLPNHWGLYDIYGNVNERISDKYARNYYAESPAVDPTGPSQGTMSRCVYRINVPQSGTYSLTAIVVTSNYEQRLNFAVNESGPQFEMELPFTLGSWQNSEPISITLEEGENTLRIWRDRPPQYGVSIKEFVLTPTGVGG